MKKLAFTFIIINLASFSIAGFTNNDSFEVNWNNLEYAQKLAKETPRPLFIEFTAKWCGWCKKMDKTTFSNSGVIKMLNEDYYAVKVDFDSPAPIDYQGIKYTGKELAKKFGIEGLPTMIYVPSSLEGSKKIVGYKTSKQLIKQLNRMNDP
ncbi:MAG: thioredoxin fold domain-containing protein [Reichenbachiella sp.]|uniref:thioredoxin family protein n=1 Tax=Reichenbachiella sp. TaxID=2184521 RepID=UPI0032664FB5